MRHRAAILAIVFVACAGNGCVRVEEPGRAAEQGRRPSDDGNVRTIYVDLNVYNPGHRPAGIGEKLRMARVLADEWAANRPGVRVEYQILGVMAGATKGEGEDLKTQLLGGIAPEIIHQNAEVAWADTDKGWYLPLDEYLDRPNRYAPGNRRWMDLFVNQALVNAKRAPDGKLYCIPLDIIETGIYYNQDLLEAHGIRRLPDTWQEMEAMFDRLEADGIVPLAVPPRLGADWGQDIIFEMLYHDLMPTLDLIPTPTNAAEYMGRYLDPPEAGFLFTKGFFTRRDPRWVEMNRLLKDWRRYWPKELKNSDTLRLFTTGRVAMIWVSSDFTRRMAYDPLLKFRWGVFYIPSMTERTSRFAHGTPASVIGGAAMQFHVTNSAVLNGNVEDCIDYLMYLTAPRNAERLINEATIFAPNIRDVQVSKNLMPFQDIFARPYCAIKWMESLDGETKQYWRRMQDYYLQGGVDLDGYLARLEGNFAAWVDSHRGEAGWDFVRMERVWREREAELRHALDPER